MHRTLQMLKGRRGASGGEGLHKENALQPELATRHKGKSLGTANGA